MNTDDLHDVEMEKGGRDVGRGFVEGGFIFWVTHQSLTPSDVLGWMCVCDQVKAA